MDYAGLIANVLAPSLGAIALVLWIIELVRGARARRKAKALEGELRLMRSNAADTNSKLLKANADRYELLATHTPTPDADEFERLVKVAGEVATALDDMLEDAEGISVATMGVRSPQVEIEYPDKLVTLHLAVEYYEAEDLEEEDAETEPEVEAVS